MSGSIKTFLWPTIFCQYAPLKWRTVTSLSDLSQLQWLRLRGLLNYLLLLFSFFDLQIFKWWPKKTLLAYWQPAKLAKTVLMSFNVVTSILICITKTTWVTSYEKIAKHGQNLRFHFLVEKWLSLGELLRKKNRKSWKHVFYTNWTILSWKKNFFENFFWIIQNSQKTEAGIFHEPLKLCGSFSQGK